LAARRRKQIRQALRDELVIWKGDETGRGPECCLTKLPQLRTGGHARVDAELSERRTENPRLALRWVGTA
jgi:hypothetical protein